MTEDVKRCIDMRVNYFDEYFIIPDEVKGEIDAFVKEMELLGEKCEDASEFESRFMETGMSDQFYGLVTKCMPKSVSVTGEQKKAIRKKTKEMLSEQKGQIFRDAVEDLATHVTVEAESELFKRNREKMVEEGTDIAFNRAVNRVNTVKNLFGFLKKKKD